MEIGTKLRRLRESSYLTQAEVAGKLGISQGTYALWEKKDTNPTLELLVKISGLYHISLDTLLLSVKATPEVIELVNNFILLKKEQKDVVTDFTRYLVVDNRTKEKNSAQVLEFKTYRKSDLYEVEVSDEELSAGFGNGVSNTQETYKVYTDTYVGRHDGAARIKGESMQPDISNGSIVTFIMGGFSINGDIYVISEGGYGEETLYCKQVFKDDEGFLCHSLNPDPQYKDFYLSEEARILGPVVNCFEEIDSELIED
ncbi:helix-turn-helix domain-containing protein [Lactococcus allomyrinae]|uniref:XRE family transcriptional regulator n=1 Tax=Lactococcus allomyrinae TaxID=2419773 RepID=A0A387BFW6_9LACT|nr:XRE family transcriptional regulator [Lactococcus allomyrinae]AYF99876.1 XRE family transcriptional regulator [Lactococcus allomyrinae]